MHPLYKEFVKPLDAKDKDACVDLVLDWLSREEIDIVTLYNEILAPSLNLAFCKDDEVCIWEEHVRTSIVRTVMENCYPFLIKERRKREGGDKVDAGSRETVVVVCPTEEYHEVGARMVADFFTLSGFEVIFVGANTPQEEIIESIATVGPRFVAISVTNYYNLVAAKRVVKQLVRARKKAGATFKIIVGGNAFRNNPRVAEEIGADMLLSTYEDIAALRRRERERGRREGGGA